MSPSYYHMYMLHVIMKRIIASFRDVIMEEAYIEENMRLKYDKLVLRLNISHVINQLKTIHYKISRVRAGE